MIIKSARIIRACNWLKTGYGGSFCTGKEEMKLLRDKALLASNIIKRIRSQNTIDELSHLPLSESIVKYLESVKDVEERARQELLDHFKNGVEYNQQIWSQQRFQVATIQNGQKLKFYPTNFVTGQLFRRFLGQNYQSTLTATLIYTGNFGISKSFSILLFAKISNMIAEYNFKSYPSKQYNNENSGIINSPKILYYNFMEDDINKSGARSIVIPQLSPEISPEKQEDYFKNQILDSQASIRYRKIKKIYRQKNIRVILFIDQISQYFSLMRRLQEQKNITNKSTNEITRIEDLIKKFKQQIKAFHSEFSSVNYFSSMDFEKDLIQKSGLQNQNQSIKQLKIPYAQFLHTDKYMREIIDVYLFQFREKLQIKLLQQAQNQTAPTSDQQVSFKKNIKAKLLDYLKSIRLDYFLSFLFIRESIQEKLDKDFLQKGQQISDVSIKFNSYDQRKLEEQIIEWFKAAIKYSEAKLQKSFKSFLQKRNINEEFFNQMIFELYIAAEIAVRTGSNFYDYEINLADYAGSLDSNEYLERSIYKQVFSIYNNIANCTVPPKLVSKILRPYITRTLLYTIKDKINLLKNMTARVGLGGCVQILFIAAILLGNKKLQLFQGGIHPVITISNISTQSSQFIEIPKNQRKKKNKETENKPVPKTSLPNTSTQLKSSTKTQELQKQEWEMKEKNYNFLDSLIPQLTRNIEQMKKNSDITEKSVVFVPINKKNVASHSIPKNIKMLESKINLMKPDEVTNLERCKVIIKSGYSKSKSLTSETSKAIDLIIVRILRSENYNLLKIYAMDMTISENTQVSKLNKFIKQFSTFKDRNQNQLLIKGQKYRVELDYLVVSPISLEDKIIDSLNSKFNNTFQFSPATTKNLQKRKHYLEVRSKKNQANCILKHVGCFNIFNGVKISPQDIKAQLFQSKYQEFELWTYLRNDLYQIAEQRKINDAEIEKLQNSIKNYLKNQDLNDVIDIESSKDLESN